MRKHLLILCCICTLYFCVNATSVNAQTVTCPDGFVCVKQTLLDKCNDTADKLIAAKDAIVQLTNERSLSIAERTAAQTLIKGLNDYLAVKDRIISDWEHVATTLRNALDAAMNLVDKVMNKLNAPRSMWAKVGAVLEKIIYIASGILIGRAGF